MKAESKTEELDARERAAIAVAEERGIVLLTDDLAAGDAASDTGVEVRGSIGIIALGYAADCSTDTKQHRVCEHSSVCLFVTEAVVERGIQMLDEQ